MYRILMFPISYDLFILVAAVVCTVSCFPTLCTAYTSSYSSSSFSYSFFCSLITSSIRFRLSFVHCCCKDLPSFHVSLHLSISTSFCLSSFHLPPRLSSYPLFSFLRPLFSDVSPPSYQLSQSRRYSYFRDLVFCPPPSATSFASVPNLTVQLRGQISRCSFGICLLT